MEYSGQRYAVSLQDMSGTRTDGGLVLKAIPVARAQISTSCR